MGSHGGSEIKRLGDDSISRIVAEQAITDLSSIVKELVDNALDAESTTIKIRLFGQGLDIIEVSDDGSGVPPPSRPYLATRYATSKISSFEDIYSGTGLTMGFRGEALFSMACLSEKLVVATRTDEDEMAQKLEFRRDGSLDPQSVESIHRKVGTTVAVVQPFAALPARRADMTRRIRAERAKLFRLMESYAIFNIGVQLNLMDMAGQGREDVALATSASSTRLEETVSSVLGHKFLSTLAPIEVDLVNMLKGEDENIYNWGMKGLISKSPLDNASGRTVHYYCINGRVVELPKVTIMLRKIWSGFGGKKKPSCIFCFTLPNDAFDINLSPDKQQVLLTQEQELCQLLQEQVTQYWSSQTNGVFQSQGFGVPVVEDEGISEQQKHKRRDVPVVEDEDNERQRHKRRFAFVHDLSKAKMQHDLEERKKCHESDKKKQSEHVSDYSTQRECPQQSSQQQVDASQPSKNPKLVSREELAESSSSQDAIRDTLRPRRRPQQEANQISDMERRKWIAIQSKFARGGNHTDIQTRLLGTALVTPDEVPPQLSIEAVGQSYDRITQATVSSRSKEQPAPESRPKKVQRQVCLQQFAFQPIGAEASTERRKEKDDKCSSDNTNESDNETEMNVVPKNVADQNIRKERRSKRKAPMPAESSRLPPPSPESSEEEHRNIQKERRSKRKAPVPAESSHIPPSIPTTAEIPQEEHRNIQKERRSKRKAPVPAESSRLSSSSPETVENPQEEQSRNHSTSPKTVAELEKCKTKKSNISSTPECKEARSDGPLSEVPLPPATSIAWEKFEGIERICRDARTERFHMRRRKNEFSEMRAGLNTESKLFQELEDRAKAVASRDPSTDSMINLSKSEFRDGMQVLGQFNLGFMLARCKKNNLWILDQHACDEKGRFEKLCRDTVFHEQKLLKPMRLDLSASEEACILDHMKVFETNGFHFNFNSEAPIRSRLSLTTLPHSGAQDGRKAVQFGKEDVSALCAILSDGSSFDAGDGGTGTDGSGKYGNNAVRRYASTTSTQPDSVDRILARLPKAIAMFASRACRTSIMIGTSLSQKEMEKVVHGLADVEHPWNCPHGRPTMRHVGNVLPILYSDERQAEEHITGPTATYTPMTQEASTPIEE